VRLKETNASEPPMTCRNVFHRCRNRDLDFCPASQGWGEPIRNTGTCRSDVKGEIQAVSHRKDQSTDAEHRGGGVRNRDEGAVMALDRRDVVIRPYPADNLQGDDQRG
jgi:hypothetical protein